jgi:N utilization substance protein B
VSARSKARKQALDLLYEGDIRSASPSDLLVTRDHLAADDDAPAIRDYTRALIEGVEAHRRKIDELIVTYAQGWDMDRMAAVDRNILRLAIFEILWANELDDSVAISEALILAKDLSTEDSASFIHGLLSTIITSKDSIAR